MPPVPPLPPDRRSCGPPYRPGRCRSGRGRRTVAARPGSRCGPPRRRRPPGRRPEPARAAAEAAGTARARRRDGPGVGWSKPWPGVGGRAGRAPRRAPPVTTPAATVGPHPVDDQHGDGRGQAEPQDGTACSHGSQVGVGSSSSYDHHAVTAMAAGEHGAVRRARTAATSTSQAPMPTRAPMAGARADRVVRVDDALAEAEHRAGHHEPAAPEQQRGRVRSVRLARHVQHEAGDEEDQRGGQQPRGLAAELGVEQAQPAGRAPPAAGLAPAADAAGLVAGQPAEAVVAEDQVEDAVVLRAADVGPRRRRHQLDDRHPPAGGHEQRHAGEHELPEPAAELGRAGDQVDEREGRARRGGPAASSSGSRSPTIVDGQRPATACRPTRAARTMA